MRAEQNFGTAADILDSYPHFVPCSRHQDLYSTSADQDLHINLHFPQLYHPARMTPGGWE
jgi:hypothetical protein